MDENNIFTIMPMAQSIDLSAGQTYDGVITVVNPANSEADFPYYVSVTPYGVSKDGTKTSLISGSERTAISKWITIDEPKGILHPNEKREIKFSIKVPDSAPPGGQYATIAVASDPDAKASDDFNIQNIYEMASVIYATVAGDIIHDGAIENNNIPGFTFSTPIQISATLSNNGNVHENAYINVAVSNFFTGQVILPNDQNMGTYTETILPETTREVSREIGNIPFLGVINVKQDITYAGQTSTVEKAIIICPVWFIAAVIIVLTALGITITRLVKRHRQKYMI